MQRFFEQSVPRKKQDDERGDPEKYLPQVLKTEEGTEEEPLLIEKASYSEFIDTWLAEHQKKNKKEFGYSDDVWPVVGTRWVQDDEEPSMKDYDEPVYGSVKEFLAGVSEEMLSDPLFWQDLFKVLPELPVGVHCDSKLHSELNELYWKVPAQIREDKKVLDTLIRFFGGWVASIHSWDKDEIDTFLLKHPEKRNDYLYDLFYKIEH